MLLVCLRSAQESDQVLPALLEKSWKFEKVLKVPRPVSSFVYMLLLLGVSRVHVCGEDKRVCERGWGQVQVIRCARGLMEAVDTIHCDVFDLSKLKKKIGQ